MIRTPAWLKRPAPPQPQYTNTARIKNDRQPHHWSTTGGYDPAQDGDDPRYGRVAIECERCGETRRIGCSLDDPRRTYGCARDGFTGRFERGDLVSVHGRLDSFANYIGTDRCATYNAGGGNYVQEVSHLVPVTP